MYIYGNFFINIFFLLIFLFPIFKSIIKLKLETKYKNLDSDPINFILGSKLITKINIGSDKNEINTEIRLDRYTIDILSKDWIQNQSKTNQIIRKYTSLDWENWHTEYGSRNLDQFVFTNYYNNNLKENNITKENITLSFLYKNKTEDDISSFGFDYNSLFNLDFTMTQFKKRNLIKDYSFSFKFNKPFVNYKNEINYLEQKNLLTYKEWCSNEGELIIGGELHKIDNNEIFKEEQFLTQYVDEIQSNNFGWKIDFDYIYSNETLIPKNYLSSNNCGSFFANIPFIIGVREYYDYINNTFFKYYIDNNICEVALTENKKYIYFVCNELKDDTSIKFLFSNFPELKFQNNKLSKNFTFNYKDLFFKGGNKIFFGIFFESDKFHPYITTEIKWKFGIPFLRKYLLSFNYDKKTIGTYSSYGLPSDTINSEQKNNKNKNILRVIKFSFVICITFILIVFLILIGMKIQKIKNDKNIKKKKANELNDEFIYEPKQIEMGQKYKLGI